MLVGGRTVSDVSKADEVSLCVEEGFALFVAVVVVSVAVAACVAVVVVDVTREDVACCGSGTGCKAPCAL